jgi:hypothetical protein
VSNPESFIEEVSEEVRRDKVNSLVRKYGWIGVLIVILIVGGAAYNEYAKAQRMAAAQAFGDGLYAALESTTPDSRLLALSEITPPETGAALLALIQAAESAGTPDAAAEALSSVANDPETPDLYRDLARLRLVMMGDAAAPVSERRALLDGMILGAGPFRLLALEQRALLEVEAGETETAIATLQEVIRAAGASRAQQQRAAQLIVALGGDVALGQG